MNRADRRRAKKHPLVLAITGAERVRAEREAALTAMARDIARSTPAPGESVAAAIAAIAALDAGIADIAAMPEASIVAGPALAILRDLRASLAGA